MVKEHGYILLPRLFEHFASIHTPFSHLLLWKLRNMHDLSLLGINATLPWVRKLSFLRVPNHHNHKWFISDFSEDVSKTLFDLGIWKPVCLCPVAKRSLDWLPVDNSTRPLDQIWNIGGKIPWPPGMQNKCVVRSERQKYRLRQSSAWFWVISVWENCHLQSVFCSNIQLSRSLNRNASFRSLMIT